MKDRLVTLIGGGGFIGRYVAQELLRAGARVRIAQREPRDAWFIKPLGGLGQTQFLAADVTRPDTLARAVEGADAVVNLVGTLAGDFEGLHVEGAANAARAATAAGAGAFVQVSAIGASPDSPSAYGRTKAAGEAAVRAAFPDATILRPAIVFGREDKFVNRFAAMVGRAPVVPVLRAGTRFQPIYVGDLAQAMARVLATPGAHGGQDYTLGGPDQLSMVELIRWLVRETGARPAIVELPDALGALLSLLPGGPITRDQWLMLQSDNVVPAGAVGLEALGIAPTPLAAVAPGWLVRYRRHGRFGKLGRAA